MNEGKVKANLKDYGFPPPGIDSATGQEKAPQFMATFTFVDNENANRELTWYGGFKELQPGKKTSQKMMTWATIQTLGFQGALNQVYTLAPGKDCNLLDTVKEYEIDIEISKDPMGAPRMKDGVVQYRIKWVNDPSKSNFKKLTIQEAQVKIGGLNLVEDGGNVAPPVNAGYANQPPVQNVQQNVQQPTYQQPPTQNVQQPVYQNHQSPVQQPGQNLTNQQMGFDANGNPPF